MIRSFKPKKCKHCGYEFIPDRPIQTVCGLGCAVALAKRKREKIEAQKKKQERQKDKARITELQPRKYWIATLKRVVHKYVRTRDEGKQCISCDTVLIKTGRVGGATTLDIAAV